MNRAVQKGIACQQQEEKVTSGTMCTYAVVVYLVSVDGRTAAVLLGCSEPVAGTYVCTHARSVDAVFSPNASIAALTRAGQLFLNEFKIKMAVDARRKWLPREKVMPGKPGGDDGDAHV